jgi:hypothetical protein
MIGRGNRSTRRKPAPVPLCPPQTPHSACTRTGAAAVGSQRLTAELRHDPASYFRTGSLPPISMSRRQSPPPPNWNHTEIYIVQHPLWREAGFVLVERHGLCQMCITNIHWFFFWMYTMPLSVQALQSRSCLSYLAYATTTDVTWTVVTWTATKFRPLIFSVSGFALSYTENIFILMIFYDFCLLPA